MKSARLCVALTLLSLCCCSSLSAQILLSGYLNGVLTDTTYLVVDTIMVRSTDSLVIEPGAQILFDGYHKFWIYGYLYAVGTPQDSIIFGPADEDSIGSVIFGMIGVGASRDCQLSYCKFTGFAGSAINTYYGGFTISHCTISNNRASWGGGIYLSHDSTSISDCVISNNQCRKNGGGIYCTGAAPTITNCLISGNVCNLLPGDSGHGGGGLCANHFSSPVITNCTFSGNHSNSAGGGLTLNDASYAVLSHCVISGNSADSSGGGLSITKSEYNPSAPVLYNCTIDGNIAVIMPDARPAMGGGIYIERSTPSLINCIISGSQGESAVCFDSSGAAVVEYCDFYNPLTDNIEGSDIPGGLGQLTSLNANGDSCDIHANLLLNPRYFDPQIGNFNLQSNSPCIDAGNPASPFDPDSTVADIGAFYFSQGAAVAMPAPPAPSDYMGAKACPNPFNPTTAISYELRTATSVRLTIWDTQGRLVTTLVDCWTPAGTHHATFDGSGLASGLYLYRLAAGVDVSTGKMVLLK